MNGKHIYNFCTARPTAQRDYKQLRTSLTRTHPSRQLATFTPAVSLQA